MAGLKELRTRIESIKSTQKITSAMKMVAAARLRRAQILAESSAVYSENIERILERAERVSEYRRSIGKPASISKLMRNKANPQKYLLAVFTSDRGLCGSYNMNVAKAAIQRIEELRKEGKDVKVVCLGRKGRDIIRRFYPDAIHSCIEGVARKGTNYPEASMITERLCQAFMNKDFDVCEAVYSRFHSVLNREIKVEQFLPVGSWKAHSEQTLDLVDGAEYDYEPYPDILINSLIDSLVKMTFFSHIINSQASEQAARMTSMDNATRNAQDMISKLTLKYNRLRQTNITTELIEIIAGAEAL